MLQSSTSEFEANDTEIDIGSVLDEQYRLVQELPSVSGRPCFLAENLGGEGMVELVLTNEDPKNPRYLVRRRSVHQPNQAVSTPPVSGAAVSRALAAFQQRVALSGVSIRCNDRLIFHGWDRQMQRPVRVVIEPAD